MNKKIWVYEQEMGLVFGIGFITDIQSVSFTIYKKKHMLNWDFEKQRTLKSV